MVLLTQLLDFGAGSDEAKEGHSSMQGTTSTMLWSSLGVGAAAHPCEVREGKAVRNVAQRATGL